MKKEMNECELLEKTTNEPKALLTLKDFSYLTGISRAGFYVMQERGEAPKVIKIGGRTRITRADFNQWLKQLS